MTPPVNPRHYMSALGATHAVPDVTNARYTDDPAKVSCPVCLDHIREGA